MIQQREAGFISQQTKRETISTNSLAIEISFLILPVWFW